MICKFITIINFDVLRATSTRHYKVLQNDVEIGNAWVKDLHVRSFKEVDRIGEFFYKNNSYHIDENVRYGVDWPFYDQNCREVMRILATPGHDKVMVTKKKLFSGKEYTKERTNTYLRVVHNGRNFKIYQLSLGKNGQYYVIYENDAVVSEIHLYDQVKDFGRTLELYMEDDEDVILMSLLYCFYLHMYEFYHCDSSIIHDDSCFIEIVSKSEPYRLKKFDQAFIDRIKAQAEYESRKA